VVQIHSPRPLFLSFPLYAASAALDFWAIFGHSVQPKATRTRIHTFLPIFCKLHILFDRLKGHLPGAISIPLLELDSGVQSVDLSKPSLVYCHEGFRATTAASILVRSERTLAISAY